MSTCLNRYISLLTGLKKESDKSAVGATASLVDCLGFKQHAPQLQRVKPGTNKACPHHINSQVQGNSQNNCH